MNELTIFTNRCPSCRWKSEVRTIKSWANDHDMTVKIKRTDMNLQYREEASHYDIEQPYVYSASTGKTIRLMGISAAEMEWLL